MKTYEGGCHCGAVRFRITADLASEEILDCNCSICTKKGFLHLIVAPERFELLTHEDALIEYRFNTMTAIHRFCGRCGIHTFYTPRSHPEMIDVNVRCIDDVDVAQLNVVEFDGRNWEANVDSIR